MRLWLGAANPHSIELFSWCMYNESTEFNGRIRVIQRRDIFWNVLLNLQGGMDVGKTLE